MHATHYLTRDEVLAGWPVRVTSYAVGSTFHCHVDNVSPGATIARASAPSAEEAERIAVQKAKDRLGQTRKRGLPTKA